MCPPRFVTASDSYKSGIASELHSYASRDLSYRYMKKKKFLVPQMQSRS